VATDTPSPTVEAPTLPTGEEYDAAERDLAAVIDETVAGHAALLAQPVGGLPHGSTVARLLAAALGVDAGEGEEVDHAEVAGSARW
jgi:hypothetical protein